MFFLARGKLFCFLGFHNLLSTELSSLCTTVVLSNTFLYLYVDPILHSQLAVDLESNRGRIKNINVLVSFPKWKILPYMVGVSESSR
jgi:hypothetical protein